IPPVEDWPYTIRLVSEILSSNGSTSMASVCGSTLALMDAGVPIKSPVAGIAMGLVTREGKFAVMTDIQGVEDMLGDMDFKVAGTRGGITALQMDTKIKGLTHEIMAQALEQAREARLFVLDKMLAAVPRPRTEMSNYAPRLTTTLINPDKFRDITGKGGSTWAGRRRSRSGRRRVCRSRRRSARRRWRSPSPHRRPRRARVDLAVGTAADATAADATGGPAGTRPTAVAAGSELPTHRLR